MTSLIATSCSWDIGTLFQHFSPEEARLIQTIPIGGQSRLDKLIWHGEKNELFSVKNGYRVACHVVLKDVVFDSSNSLTKW